MVAISTIVAPIIAGTLTIREYFTAYERVMPPIIRGGQCDKALNHATDYSSRDGGQNQQESKHTVVAAEYLPVLLSLLMLTGKVFL